MFSARAARMAAPSRGFIPGSGSPSFAATVISRASLEKSFERTASCRPLRCMMFLNCECPAMASGLSTTGSPPRGRRDRSGNRDCDWRRVIGREPKKIQNAPRGKRCRRRRAQGCNPVQPLLEYKLHRRRNVAEPVALLGKPAEPGPRHVVDEQRNPLRREHVEDLDARFHALLRIGIEVDLDTRLLEQDDVMREIADEADRLAARRDHVDGMSDRVPGRMNRLNAG